MLFSNKINGFHVKLSIEKLCVLLISHNITPRVKKEIPSDKHSH